MRRGVEGVEGAIGADVEATREAIGRGGRDENEVIQAGLEAVLGRGSPSRVKVLCSRQGCRA